MHSGIYQLQYHTCHLSYLGETGQCLEQRHKERIRYIPSNKPQSAYALYILHSKQIWTHECHLIHNSTQTTNI
jgi:hypothetical protein